MTVKSRLDALERAASDAGWKLSTKGVSERELNRWKRISEVMQDKIEQLEIEKKFIAEHQNSNYEHIYGVCMQLKAERVEIENSMMALIEANELLTRDLVVNEFKVERFERELEFFRERAPRVAKLRVVR